MRVDHGGAFWDTVFDVISVCASVVDVVKNPKDPWAWVGLGADVLSLAVPFATTSLPVWLFELTEPQLLLQVAQYAAVLQVAAVVSI